MSNQEEVIFLSPEEKEELINLVSEKQYQDVSLFIKDRPNHDFTFTDDHGNTILHYLVKSCNKDTDNGQVLPLAQMLLERGVSHTAVNSRFRSPYDYAADTSNAPLIGLFKGFPVYID